MAAKLKKGDNVVVLVGKDIGRTGEILSVNPKKGKAVVKEVNLAIRHMRQTQTQKGGKQAKEMPIDLSNLAYADPEDGTPTRVGFRIEEGRKVRFAKKSGRKIDG